MLEEQRIKNSYTEINFSVLMAVYGKDDPELLDMALKSVYANSLTPREVILVQDGPVNNQLTYVINQFKIKRGFIHIALSSNQGLAAALNFGLEKVTTQYVFRADADDYNLPNRFEKQLPFLIHDFDLVGGGILETDKSRKPIAIRRPPSDYSMILRFITKRNPFNHMTVAYRLESVKSVGGYPSIYLKEDYALWVNMIAGGAKVSNLDDILVEATAGYDMYRRRGGFKYIRSEIDIQKLMVRLGLQTPLNAVLIGISRSIIFLMPVIVRAIFYEYFLRKKI